MTSDEWTESKCLELIHEFKERPMLWDQKNPLFYKKALKPDAWVEIGEVLNIPADKCRHKMVILMSSFRREKAKLANALKYGKGFQRSTWFGFPALSFLLERDNAKKRKSTEILDEDFEYTDDDGISKTEDLFARQRKILKADDDVIKVTTVMEEPQNPTASQQNEDEIKFFSNFIASKMMKYSETVKNTVQQAICEVIFKADQNFYEQTRTEIGEKPRDISKKSSTVIEQQPTSSDVSIKVYYSESESD